ncbi:MAG TPA: hypothetical protein VHW66_16825 [Stellaceae bacterium]|jgi:hypothetical protein|nr:hypothetical protein [Stellaceae bacterium]
MIRSLAALVLVAAAAGCAPGGQTDLAAAVAPADVARAMCLQYRHGDAASCAATAPPLRASETAYRLCLDYHPVDPRPCKAVREAYEADLRAFYEAPEHKSAAGVSTPEEGGMIGEGRYRQLHRTAEQLYVATSRDAETFKAAILIPEVRRKVERVIGPVDDEKLQALSDKSRAEALYWYQYMQGLEQMEPAY